MACRIEDVAIFFYFAASERLKCARETAAYSHGISDVAKSMLQGLISCVYITTEFLGLPALDLRSYRWRYSIQTVDYIISDGCQSFRARYVGVQAMAGF